MMGEDVGQRWDLKVQMDCWKGLGLFGYPFGMEGREVEDLIGWFQKVEQVVDSVVEMGIVQKVG